MPRSIKYQVEQIKKITLNSLATSNMFIYTYSKVAYIISPWIPTTLPVSSS